MPSPQDIARAFSTVVSSCDVYEFRQGRVTTITTYAVELDGSPESATG